MQTSISQRGIAAIAVAIILIVAVAHAGQKYNRTRTRNNGFSTTTDGPVRGCSDVKVFFDDRPVAQAEQNLAIPRGSAPTLRAHLQGPFGISAFTGTSADYSVVVCKYAAENFGSSASSRLDSIHVTAQNGEISASVPDEHDTMVYLIIQAPAGVALDLSTHNGPLDLHDLSGKITANVQNGPLNIDHCTGEVDGTAENGPISVSGYTGKFHLRGQNGPLSVRLDGTRWENGGIDGSTQNGPLNLSVAEGYRSGIVVETDGYSPFSCHAAACRGANRTWDDRWRRIEIGQQPVVVRLSTQNGPVSVDSK